MNLVDYITGLGVFAVLFVIFAESGLLVGFFFPGDSLLFTAGVLVNAGVLHININLLVFLLFVAAIAGNSTGYLFGRRVGPKIFNRPNSLLFKKENITYTQNFYEKHGGSTIIIAQFIPLVRTFAPIVAGVGKMTYKRFVSFSLIGAALWTAGVTYLGYSLGYFFKSIGIDIDTILLPIIAIIILGSISPAVYQILKDKSRRAAIVNGIKEQFRVIFKRKK
jgi:membrane-associated protein